MSFPSSGKKVGFAAAAAAVGALVIACGDMSSTLEPELEDLVPTADQQVDLTFGAQAAGPPVRFHCSVAERTSDGQRFWKTTFELPRRFAPEDGAHDWVVVKKERDDGRIARVAICDVPISIQAFRMVSRRFIDSRPSPRRLERGEFGLPHRPGPVVPLEAGLSGVLALFVDEGDCIAEDGWQWDEDAGPNGMYTCDFFELGGLFVTVCGEESDDPSCWDWNDVQVVVIEWEDPPPPDPPEDDDSSSGGSSGSGSDGECASDDDEAGGSGGSESDEGGGSDEDGSWGEEDDDEAVGSCDDDDEPQLESLRVECDKSSVVRGGSISCEFIIEPDYASNFHITGWRFEGSGFSATRSAWAYWSGEVVVGGKVTVEYQLDGSATTQTSLPDSFSVTDRAWSWAGSVDIGHASPGQFDACMSPGAFGQTVGISCTAANPGVLFTPASQSSGYELEEVPSGPNRGIWYVESVSTSMHLRAQIIRDLRTDGDHHGVTGVQAVVDACRAAFGTPIPAQNNHSVNTQCTQTSGFSNLVSTVWSHEDGHLDAGLLEAQQPSNDVHGELEGMVGADDGDLGADIIFRLNEIHDQIFDAAVATHTGQQVSYNLWWYTPSQEMWTWSTATAWN